MLKYISMVMTLLMLPFCLQAATWSESCPQMEVKSPFQYNRIWTPDDAWVKKPMPSNQPILMSCGNWKVMGQEMICYFGGYKTTYDYSLKKDIPEGATCERSGQCQFECKSQTLPQKLVPNIKAPIKAIPK